MTSKIDLNSLSSFLVVARERSFTRAAAQLGVTQSALSHSMRSLEEKIGVRLLARTTRGASPTEAGERLLSSLSPHYEGIEAELAAISELREKPSGTIRITTHDHAANTILWPKLSKLLADYPDITLEINVGYGLIDIVAERFDAGVRVGDQIAKDMIAVRISPDFRMAVVGSPGYFEKHPTPVTPQDLTSHNCTNLRMATHGGLYAWEFAKGGKELHVQVTGQMIFNTSSQTIDAALGGTGWPTRLKMSCTSTWLLGAWCECWKTGVRPFRAIACTTRAVGNLYLLLHLSWRRSGFRTDSPSQSAASATAAERWRQTLPSRAGERSQA